MNPTQRNDLNNQVDNGGNEKWNEGAKGKTADGPMDHTYPAGVSRQQGQQVDDGSVPQSGTGPGVTGGKADLPGGSMQTQQTGGTGAVQGVTDSHDRAMKDRSGARGDLEQPVPGRAQEGTSVRQPQGATTGTESGRNPGPQNPRPERQGGTSKGNRQTGSTEGTQRDSENMQSQQSTGSNPERGVGARQGEPDVHQSNDVAGGLPKSPGGANRLAADQKMDDDTGLSNTVNQQAAIDEGTKQAQQSNVGRRDDMTPD